MAIFRAKTTLDELNSGQTETMKVWMSNKVLFREYTKCIMGKKCRKYPTPTGCSAQLSQRETW